MVKLSTTIKQALSLAQAVSPTGTIQQNFANLCESTRKEEGTENAVVLALINAIHDGLSYGNRP